MKKIKRIVRENINQRFIFVKSEEDIIKLMNPKIRGLRNYYQTRNDGNG